MDYWGGGGGGPYQIIGGGDPLPTPMTLLLNILYMYTYNATNTTHNILSIKSL